MPLKYIKATLLVAFLVFTALLTYIGLNKKEASIDFKGLEQKRTETGNAQSQADFDNLLRNIGSSTTLIKSDILQSQDTARLALAIQLLDTNQQYTYAGVLSEKLANIQNSGRRHFLAGRYFLMETYSHPNPENELMFIKKSRSELEKAVELDPSNLDAQVDLAVCIYNINKIQPPENQMEIMKPVQILLSVNKANPDHADALLYLGKLAVESNQLDKAIERFKKLVSLQPQNPEYCMELSKAYGLKGDEQEAKKWAEKARELGSIK